MSCSVADFHLMTNIFPLCSKRSMASILISCVVTYQRHPVLSQCLRNTGGIYTTPSFLSPETKYLLTSMLVVDPLKRITIHEIRQNPWFNVGLPEYLRPLPDTAETLSQEIDESILSELCKVSGSGTLEKSVRLKVLSNSCGTHICSLSSLENGLWSRDDLQGAFRTRQQPNQGCIPACRGSPSNDQRK